MKIFESGESKPMDLSIQSMNHSMESNGRHVMDVGMCGAEVGNAWRLRQFFSLFSVTEYDAMRMTTPSRTQQNNPKTNPKKCEKEKVTKAFRSSSLDVEET